MSGYLEHEHWTRGDVLDSYIYLEGQILSELIFSSVVSTLTHQVRSLSV